MEKQYRNVLALILTASLILGGCSHTAENRKPAQRAGDSPAGQAGVTAEAARTPVQMEYLDRGTVAVMTDEGVYLSWRLLGTDDFETVFSVFRNGSEIALISDTTNYLDAEGGPGDLYCVSPNTERDTKWESVKETVGEKIVSVLPEGRIKIPLNVPAGGVSEDGEMYSYSVNDAVCADLNGDGEYELILKWDPSNSFDSGKSARHSGNVFIDAYKLSGEMVWRIDLGPNISAGDHFSQLAVYDFDLDGKAELALKTAPGSVDGTGSYVSEASGISPIHETDNKADYRSKAGTYGTTGGRVLDGEEYLTIFEGSTGKAMDTVYYPFPRGSVSEWGDDWGNRSERYLAAVAYLDGVHPHFITWRGYYAKTTAAAYRLENNRLILAASFDSSAFGSGQFDGQGNHNISIADVDDDGKDEIICGSLALDDDLSVLWCSGRGHGDASHLADYDPLHKGLEYFCVHESAPYGMSVYDAATGNTLFHADGACDTGRGMMAHVGYSDCYYEIWATYSHNASEPEDYVGRYACNGGEEFQEAEFWPDSQNFRIFWDGNLYDELLDGNGTEGAPVHISGKDGVIAAFPETKTINRTKQNVCLTADLLGDWREEFVVPSSDGRALYIYTTTIPTSERLYTLMHDRTYRMQAATQNAGYNQPPHLGYYVSNRHDEHDARKSACDITTVHEGTEFRRSKQISPSGK